MENPEAFLDILTIRSLKERYHVDSDTDESVSTMLTNNDDLESFVRDFAIDDSISDCFADESDEPSSTLQFPKTSKSYVSDSDLNSVRPMHYSLTVSNKSHNAANLHCQSRHKNDSAAVMRSKSTALDTRKESLPSSLALIATQKPSLGVDAFESGTKTALKSQNLYEHLEKRTTLHALTQNDNPTLDSIPAFIPNESSLSKSTEVIAKVDKASKVCKQSKFGLKQVWSNTLKKCITKKNSIQNDDEDSLCNNGFQINDNNKCIVQKSFSSGLNSEHFQDFDDLFSSRLNGQLQAKSEPDLSSSKADVLKSVNENVLNKRTERLLPKKFEEVTIDILSVSDKQAACHQCAISKDSSKILSESSAEESKFKPKDFHGVNSLKKNIPSSSFANLINAKPDNTIFHDSGHQMDSGDTIRAECQDMDTNSNISPSLKIGLLDKINEALFQRILFTLLKQTRCSSILSDILEKFMNNRVIETMSAAVAQLQQLLFMSNRSHDINRIVEMIHKNLQNTLSQLNQLRVSLENLKIEMPFTKYDNDDGPKEDNFQPRSLLTDTYNIVKNQPPDLNNKIQDLISFHLKSRLLALSNGQNFFRESHISENRGIKIEDHKLRMTLNSNDHRPLVKVSDIDVSDSLPDLSSDAQTIISNKSREPKQRLQHSRHGGQAPVYHSGSRTVSSHFMYSGTSDHFIEKVASPGVSQMSSNGQSVRSSDCKCHQTCRHGRKSAERRQDRCKHRNRDTRRCRRKGRRSASDSRYSRRRNTISSFTTSSMNTLSTATSTQSVDRHNQHRRHKSRRTFRSSSSSSRHRNNYDADEYWSDNESDDDDDDEDDDYESYTPLVRLNLDNEDLPHEALRIDRLHRHLESVKKLHQSSEDIIETIITGTGEKLIPNDHFVPEPTSTDEQDQSNQWYVAQHSELSSRPTKLQGEGQKSTKMNVFKTRRIAVAQMFNHEKVLLGNMRELTDSEFEETFDRRHDVSVKRRQQMDSEIPWDQLSFSESESDDQKP